MRTRQGETICLGEWIRLASADFPPAGGVWGGMRAGFGFAKIFFVANYFPPFSISLNICPATLNP